MGTKRSVLTDEKGIPLSVVLDGANRHDIKLLEKTLNNMVKFKSEVTDNTPQNLCLDAGYTGAEKIISDKKYILHIRPRGEEKEEKIKNPNFKARRWVVEVTHSFFNRFRNCWFVMRKKKGIIQLSFILLVLSLSGEKLFPFINNNLRIGSMYKSPFVHFVSPYSIIHHPSWYLKWSSTMRLIDYLKNYNCSCPKTFHMPGHKRNILFADYLARMGADIDFTEIDAADDLHHAQGILKTCMQKAEKLWHSQHSFFMVNGATGGILAGIRACTHYGDKVLVIRNCHKSVYNAIELFGLNAVYLLPEYIPEYDIYGSVSPQKIKQAIKENPDIRLIILTSPTYEGIISDIRTISEIAHRYHIPLLTDEAHGSHLDLSAYFTGGSVKNGSDISVQSLHKTLPSLTQSAVIHLNSEMVSAEDLQRQLAVFQTSSPSYLLMSSADACIEMIHDTSLFEKWYESLTAFKERITPLQHLRILGYTDSISDNQRIFGFDYSKILISCADTNITGKELQSLLKQHYNIDFEMYSGNSLLAMTSMADTQKDLMDLADSLLQTDRTLKTEQKERLSVYITQLPQRAISLSDAVNHKGISYIPIEQSVGRISGEYIWIYPPGIPLITPCEIVSQEIADILHSAVHRQLNVQHTLSPAAAQIAVISETI